jgi:small subunit ribosomal protein S17
MGDRGKRKVQVGVVTSDKMDKTVVVRVSHLVKHSEYNKYVKRSVKFKAHDENNSCRVGDRVQIIESRPLSKDKRWKIKQILEKTS